MRLTLTTRNASGIAANFYAADARAQRAVRKTVRTYGVKESERVRELCPVDTGFMRSQLRLEFSEQGLAYELGWREEDFANAGLVFYPVFQEFGTVNMPAQPSLFPARDEIRPQFRDALRRDLSAAIRRKGDATP